MWQWKNDEWQVIDIKTGKLHKYKEACLFIYTWLRDNTGIYTMLEAEKKMIKRGRIEFRLF